MADHHHFSRYASFHLPSAAAAPPPAAIAAAPYDPHHSRIPPAPLPLPLPSQILARPPPPPSGPSPLYEPQEPLFTLIKKPLPIAEFDSRLIQDSRLHQFDCGPPPSSSSRVSIRPFPKGDRPNVDYGDSRPGRWESSGCLPPHNQVSSSEFSAGQYSHITYDRNPAVRYRDRSRIEHESSYRSNRNVYSDRYDCEDYRDRDRNLLNAERSSSSSGYCYPNSNSSSQLRDYAENFGNSESQYSSVSDEYYMDVEEELGQNCRRGRTTTRFEMGSKINRNCDAYWLDSGRRMSHVSESGKYNSRGIREGSREHIRPPRRKAQKKSALERLEEPTSRNWSETSSLLFYGSQPSSYRGKDLPVHSDHRVDERRHGSPVELDVSFKSNVLVAKIAAPSSPSSASYRRSPHRAKKYRKVVTPDRDVSGLPENKLNECPVKSDCITQAAGEPSNSLSELNQSEEAVGFASSETFHDIKSVSCSNEIIASSLKSSVGSEGGAISIGGEAAHVSYDEKSVVKVRKRVKVAESPSCSSELIVINKHDESLSGDGSLCLPSAASGCCTVVTDAKEKLTSSSLVTKNKILSPLSLNEFLDKSDGFPNCISGKNSDDVDADTSFPGKITRRSSSNCLLDSSSPETTKTSENLVNAGLSVDCLRLIRNTGGNALIDIKDSNTGSEFETLISSRLSGHCDTIVQSENSDGKGCSANVILAEGNVDIPLLSPKDISVHKSPIHTHNSSHAMITTVNYVGSLINSNDTVCIPGIGKNREQSNQIELHLPHKDVVSKEFSKAISSEEIGASLVVLNSDCADHSARTAPGSGRGLGNNLEHEPTIGNNVVVDNLNKVLCPGLPTLSPEYDAKHQSLEAKGSLGDDPAIVSNKDDGPCSSKMIVRSLQSDVSDLTSNGTNTGSMIRVNPSNGVDKNSEEDSVLTGCGSLAAGSEPCTVETNTSSVKNFIKQFDRVKYSVSDDVNVSVETLNSCKKKRKSFSPHQVVSAPVSGISDGSQSALHLANGNVMPFNFDAHTTESENEFAVPITGIEHTTFLLYSPLKTENCFEGRSSETSDSAGDGCGRDSLSVDSYSSVPLGLVGEHSEEREKATQVAPAANLQNDIKDRESEVSRDMLQGYLAERMETLLPQDAVLSQMRLSINMDDNCLLPEKHALPSMSRCASLWAHGIKASNSNCDDSADNAVSNTTTQNLSVKTHLPMLYANLPPSDYSSEALSGDDWKIEVTNGGSELPGHEKVSQNSEIAANVASPTKSDDLVLGKSFVLHSQCPKTTESLAHNTEGLNGQKKQMSYVVPRGYTPLASTSLKKAVFSNSVARPRTWHRTVDPSLSLLPGKVSSAPLPSPRQSQAETKRPPSTSYIRKGNSLVRKSASATSFSQNSHGLSSSVYRLNASSSDKVKHNGSDSRVDMVEPLKIGENCHSGRPLSPPSQQNTNLSTCISTLSGDHMSSVQASSHQDDSSEKMSHGPKLSESKDTPKSSEDALKNIVYVKCNSNQLIATSNASNTSTHDENKTHVLPSDGYYKRNNNQLIRTSVENDSLPIVFLPGDGSTSEEQRASKAFSSKGLNKRRSEFFVKKLKPSKSSLVWTLGGSQLLKSSGYSSECKAVLPHLFPWKRKAYLRRSLHNLPSDSSSLSMIGRKLLHLRKRDTIYTRSYCGFSLRKSKVLSVGGANLKWSKSIERRSKKANEEATIAVAEAERKKRQQRGDACVPSRRRSRNQSSRERIFRIGLDRYKMDSSRRTLQRISDDKPCPVPVQPENKLKSSYVPRRLLIGNNEYVRVGNGNQLIRDPKKRTRALASEKVRWSLHTARLRLAKKRKYCQFYTRFGKCNKDSGRCPYIHDPSKIAVCTKFLNGLCSNANCKLTHKVIPERMQDCSYFLQGLCSNEQCPYRHVNVNPNASVCEGFLKGYCADGDECRKKHSYVCPDYEATGVCPRESNCKLHHPKKRSKGKKRKQSEGMNARGRYFGYIHMNNAEAVVTVNDRHDMLGSDDIFYKDGKFADYISLDVNDEEAGESYAIMSEQTITSDNIPSVVESDDLDHLIKPIRIMENHLGVQPSELQAAF